MKRLHFFLFLFGLSAFSGFSPPVYSLDTQSAENQLSTIDYDSSNITSQIESISKSVSNASVQYTLQECIDMALERNPIIMQYFYSVKAQEKAVLAKQMLWMPTLSVEASPLIADQWLTERQDPVLDSFSSDSSSSGISSTSIDDYNVFTSWQVNDLDATLQWNIIDFTRTPQIKLEFEILDQQKYLYNLALRNLISNVSSAYIQLQGTKQKLEGYLPVLKAASNAVKAVSKQYEFGIADIGNLSQAQNQELNLLTQYINTYISYQSASSKLLTLMNNDLENIVSPLDKLVEPADWHLSLSESISVSQDRNEYKKSLLALADSKVWQAAYYRNSYLPQIYLYAYGSYDSGYGVYESPLGEGSISDNIYSSSSYEGMTGIGFTWNFDGGTSYFDAKSSELQAKSFEEQAKSIDLQYLGFVRSAYSTLMAEKLGINYARNGVKSAKNNLLVLTTVSNYGLTNITTNIQSLDLYRDSVDELADSLIQSNLALNNLYRYTSIWPPNIKLNNTPFNLIQFKSQ